MPDYGFYCHACMKTFSKGLTRAVYEEGEILCPHCSSDKRRTELVRLLPHQERLRPGPRTLH